MAQGRQLNGAEREHHRGDDAEKSPSRNLRTISPQDWHQHWSTQQNSIFKVKATFELALTWGNSVGHVMGPMDAHLSGMGKISCQISQCIFA
jgi:hypothetical protein